VKNWKQLRGNDAPITIYGRDDTSGVQEFLEDEFMADQSISSSARTFPTNARMWETLSADPNGIGFGTGELGTQPGVRFLSIRPSDSGEAIEPSGDAIRAKRYKLTRPLYFYFAGTPTGDVARFAEWVLTPEGQLVVESEGYYPLASAEREEGMRLLAGSSGVRSILEGAQTAASSHPRTARELSGVFKFALFSSPVLHTSPRAAGFYTDS
jgi:phosphate transport system substrate-binding protein